MKHEMCEKIGIRRISKKRELHTVHGLTQTCFDHDAWDYSRVTRVDKMLSARHRRIILLPLLLQQKWEDRLVRVAVLTQV